MKAILRVNFEVDLKVNESELKALDALVGYGTENFLKCFYEHMGKSYLEPHEAGLRSLFQKIEEIRPAVAAVDDIKKMSTEVASKYR